MFTLLTKSRNFSLILSNLTSIQASTGQSELCLGLPSSNNHVSLPLAAYSSALVTQAGRFYEMSVKFNETVELQLTFHKTKIFITIAKITSSFPFYSISVTRNLVMLSNQTKCTTVRNPLDREVGGSKLFRNTITTNLNSVIIQKPCVPMSQ